MAPGITKEKILELQKENSMLHLIDIRSADEYNVSHVPGAENIVAEEIGNISFDKNDTIVCICNQGHKRSQGTADAVFAMGFENTFYLEGGTVGWHVT